MIGRAVAVVALAAATCACSARLVAPLDRAEVTPVADQAFRERVPDASPVVPVVPLPFRVARLPNGLRIVHLERRTLPIVTVRLVIERGGADAGAPLDAGALLGELIEAGTRSKSKSELAGAWAALGASHFVSLDDDSYDLGATVGSGDLDAAAALVAEMAIAPGLTGKALDDERTEWLSDVDNGRWSTPQLLRRNGAVALFGREHAYAHTLRGRDEIRALGIEQIAALHARVFQPSQATLVVVGDAPAGVVDEIAARRFGAWASTVDPLPRSTAAPPVGSGPRVLMVSRLNMQEVDVMITARAPASGDPDLATSFVIARMLGGLSSRLRGELTEDSGASYSMDARVSPMRLASYVALSARLSPGKALPAMQAMLAAVEKLGSRGVAQDDLDRARAGLLAGFRTSAASTPAIAGMVADAIGRGETLDDVASFPQRIAAVTRDDVRRVARKFLGEEALRVIVVGPPAVQRELEKLGLGAPERRNEWGAALR